MSTHHHAPIRRLRRVIRYPPLHALVVEPCRCGMTRQALVTCSPSGEVLHGTLIHAGPWEGESIEDAPC